MAGGTGAGWVRVRVVGRDGAGFGRSGPTRALSCCRCCCCCCRCWRGAALRSFGPPACLPACQGPTTLALQTARRCVAPLLPQAVRAEQDGADYLGAGAVFPTGTKETGGWVPWSVVPGCGMLGLRMLLQSAVRAAACCVSQGSAAQHAVYALALTVMRCRACCACCACRRD